MLHVLDRADVACGRGGTGFECLAKKALAQCIELEFDKQGFQFFFVPRDAFQIVRFDVERHVAVNRNQFLGKHSLLAVFFDPFLLFSLEFVRMVEQIFDAAILSDQFLGGLLTHARNPGHVVRTVAHQAQDIDHLVDAFDLPLLQNLADTLNFNVAGATRFTDEGAVRNQLPVVLVGCDHIGCKTVFLRLTGKRSDHVVRFPSGYPDNGQVERFAQAENVGKRRAQILGHGLALGLVFGEHPVPVGRLGCIENNAYMAGIRVVQNIQQGVREHEYRRRIQAGGGHARVADHGEMGTVNQRHSVQEVELFLCFAHCFLPTPALRRRSTGVLIFLAIGTYAAYLVPLIDKRYV